MAKETKQIGKWTTDFGKEYTKRNFPADLEGLESMYKNRFRLTRTEMNQRFLKSVDHSARILEVGANTGNQLMCLKRMGFSNLFGIEPQAEAIELSKCKSEGILLLQGTAFDIPFEDGEFDLVFTSGVLIHIAPSDLPSAMKEIYRVSKKYIWGFEYWSEQWTEISYRGQNDLLWKTDYAREYRKLFPDLSLIQKEKFKYSGEENQDAMFLLKKGK
ncbi:MAG: methyltransferase domain-containing protein [Candidatus Omnitrophica bacterium]|nr:methyltransferase domain-containing protein [Candidatus Omnitrophota bacterium]